MDVKRLLADYHINFITDGNKHCTSGWANVHCPFCAGSKDYHLGIHEEGTGANCWRCGPHNIIETISTLLRVPEKDARRIMRNYGGTILRRKEKEPEVAINPLRFPKPHSELTGPYKQYLEKRNYDVEKITKLWGLRQTGPSSFLDDINYSHRVLIPIIWNGEIVSFQARDITGQSKLKYLACPKKREKIHHKEIIYCQQEKLNPEGVIVVEGVPDVWRLGTDAVATFGIEFKVRQVLEISKLADRFFIIFDEGAQAQKKARELAVKLKTLGRTVEVIQIEGDPGEMAQEDADYMVKQLLKEKERRRI